MRSLRSLFFWTFHFYLMVWHLPMSERVHPVQQRQTNVFRFLTVDGNRHLLACIFINSKFFWFYLAVFWGWLGNFEAHSLYFHLLRFLPGCSDAACLVLCRGATGIEYLIPVFSIKTDEIHRKRDSLVGYSAFLKHFRQYSSGPFSYYCTLKIQLEKIHERQSDARDPSFCEMTDMNRFHYCNHSICPYCEYTHQHVVRANFPAKSIFRDFFRFRNCISRYTRQKRGPCRVDRVKLDKILYLHYFLTF